MAESSFLNPGAAVRAAGIHEGMSVADFGAGAGFFTRAAAREVGDSGVVWAVDSNRELLVRVKNLALAEGLHNVEVMRAALDGESALPAEHFDFVVAANVLFGAHDKPALVGELKRVLKRHGRALVIDWRDSFGGLGPHPDHVVTEAQAKKLFEDFSVVEEIPAGEYHWGFVVRKKL